MKLKNIINKDLILTSVNSSNTNDILEELTVFLKDKNMITDAPLILNKLIEREKLASTSIGNHTAIPHTKIKELKKPILLLAISRPGILYNENDEEPVHLIILILSPSSAPAMHLQILAAAASLIKKRGNLIKDILKVNNNDELIEIIEKYEKKDD
ncbi:MAG: PTS sugar transporter subunit IIA [Acidobacteriota bacterium]